MRTNRRGLRSWITATCLVPLLALAGGLVLWSGPATSADEPTAVRRGNYVIPFASAERGRALFTGKGCVVCHSVNGVGGKAGPALDADPSNPDVDIFAFAARMWRGAPLMAVLQEMEMGYQIEFTGAELADIAQFLHDVEVQKEFDESDVPELIRDWMVDEVYDQLDLEDMAQ